MTARRPSCIVLGGGGFLGINLCRRLDSAGYRVRAFGRHCLFPRTLDQVEWYQGDFTDATALAAAIETNDIVFHLLHATTPQSANLDMAGDLKQNVVASVGLLDISRSLGVRRVVFVSSGGTVYGPTNELPTPETAATEPITAYGISKLAIEKYLALYERLFGLEYRILRVANPFGPFQVPVKHQGIIATLISQGLRGESIDIWGDGTVIRDYIFVDDVVSALENVMSDESNVRVFNIGSGEGRSLLQVIDAIENLLNKRLQINWSAGRRIDVPKSVLSIERARGMLRWKPETSFEEGLRRTLDWWKSKEGGCGAS
jgi:UDP-glucose 4-epimerase